MLLHEHPSITMNVVIKTEPVDGEATVVTLEPSDDEKADLEDWIMATVDDEDIVQETGCQIKHKDNHDAMSDIIEVIPEKDVRPSPPKAVYAMSRSSGKALVTWIPSDDMKALDCFIVEYASTAPQLSSWKDTGQRYGVSHKYGCLIHGLSDGYRYKFRVCTQRDDMRSVPTMYPGIVTIGSGPLDYDVCLDLEEMRVRDITKVHSTPHALNPQNIRKITVASRTTTSSMVVTTAGLTTTTVTTCKDATRTSSSSAISMFTRGTLPKITPSIMTPGGKLIRPTTNTISTGKKKIVKLSLNSGSMRHASPSHIVRYPPHAMTRPSSPVVSRSNINGTTVIQLQSTRLPNSALQPPKNVVTLSTVTPSLTHSRGLEATSVLKQPTHITLSPVIRTNSPHTIRLSNGNILVQRQTQGTNVIATAIPNNTLVKKLPAEPIQSKPYTVVINNAKPESTTDVASNFNLTSAKHTSHHSRTDASLKVNCGSLSNTTSNIKVGHGNATLHCGPLKGSSMKILEQQIVGHPVKGYKVDIISQPKSIISNDIDTFVCNFCIYKSSTEQEMEHHVGMVHTFRCTECSSEFFTRFDLVKHRATSHMVNNSSKLIICKLDSSYHITYSMEGMKRSVVYPQYDHITHRCETRVFVRDPNGSASTSADLQDEPNIAQKNVSNSQTEANIKKVNCCQSVPDGLEVTNSQVSTTNQIIVNSQTDTNSLTICNTTPASQSVNNTQNEAISQYVTIGESKTKTQTDKANSPLEVTTKKFGVYKTQYTKQWPVLLYCSLSSYFVWCDLCKEHVCIIGGETACESHVNSKEHTTLSSLPRDVLGKLPPKNHTFMAEYSMVYPDFKCGKDQYHTYCTVCCTNVLIKKAGLPDLLTHMWSCANTGEVRTSPRICDHKQDLQGTTINNANQGDLNSLYEDAADTEHDIERGVCDEARGNQVSDTSRDTPDVGTLQPVDSDDHSYGTEKYLQRRKCKKYEVLAEINAVGKPRVIDYTGLTQIEARTNHGSCLIVMDPSSDTAQVDLSSYYTFDKYKDLAVCLHCDITYQGKCAYSSIRIHVLEHVPGKVWSCVYCGFDSNVRNHMLQHCSTVHPDDQLVIKRNIDYSKTGPDEGLKIPNKYKLNRDVYFLCRYCPRSMKHYKDMLTHMRHVHSNEQITKGPHKLWCTEQETELEIIQRICTQAATRVVMLSLETQEGLKLANEHMVNSVSVREEQCKNGPLSHMQDNNEQELLSHLRIIMESSQTDCDTEKDKLVEAAQTFTNGESQTRAETYCTDYYQMVIKDYTSEVLNRDNLENNVLLLCHHCPLIMKGLRLLCQHIRKKHHELSWIGHLLQTDAMKQYGHMVYVCHKKGCGEIYRYYMSLHLHFRLKHASNHRARDRLVREAPREYKCVYCSFGADEVEKCHRHWQIHHYANRMVVLHFKCKRLGLPWLLHTCPDACGFTTSDEAAYDEHYKPSTCASRCVHQCVRCPSITFKHHNAMREHLQKDHSISTWDASTSYIETNGRNESNKASDIVITERDPPINTVENTTGVRHKTGHIATCRTMRRKRSLSQRKNDFIYGEFVSSDDDEQTLSSRKVQRGEKNKYVGQPKVAKHKQQCNFPVKYLSTGRPRGRPKKHKCEQTANQNLERRLGMSYLPSRRPRGRPKKIRYDDSISTSPSLQGNAYCPDVASLIVEDTDIVTVKTEPLDDVGIGIEQGVLTHFWDNE